MLGAGNPALGQLRQLQAREALPQVFAQRPHVLCPRLLHQWVPVAGGGPPRGLAVNAVTNRIYVARSLTADVLVIDGATNAIIATVALAGASE